ncbi:Uncharacterised protein [Yersinia frederiksenii]|uniref:Uncharacterized protein n=2 Tax=Yersinia frederiksenii TaxID=29484 RepID=A0A380PR69_YERFR|nr:hypothetical protein [Yersinia frederiksenii]ATM95621.1 hypothetical protein CRN75_09710 [Yersinia frederiksenii]KGA44890.1 hypothetical protein DJ58_4457 [Yersinia frederiksenii ATCC 33641]MDN0117882.1 hypothetical protein [Yersinia frederiksenii]CNG45573.1 Uncharacterised protein [Yersinia frederiksenii]SUP75752.1 Uncharacterised protein [Yersinia frederiksenii]
MDIEITSPISIALDVIELDEHIPSLKFNLVIQVNKFSYSLKVSTQAWLECKCFDAFIDNMRNDDIAHLKDMNGCFELILNPVLGWLEWSCAKEDLHGYVSVSKGREKLTDEAKSAIYTAFNNYPKWW